jgi:quinol monooxygenase YgiN
VIVASCRSCLAFEEDYIRGSNGAFLVIRHIVFFTAKPANLDAVVEGLELLGQIPHSEHFEVTRNTKVDQFGNDIDVVVYAEFADEAALAAYKAHPLYAEATRRVRPLREQRFAADVLSRAKVALRRSA